jgi:hypothetical protein
LDANGPIGVGRTPGSFTDGFIIDGRHPKGPSFVGTQGAPMAGTPFVYGNAGPPRGYAWYDSGHRIAFYGQGCCAWHEVALAAGAPPPPVPVADRDLSNVATEHGIKLGMSVTQVEAIYGKSTPYRVRGFPTFSAISYVHTIDKNCVQGQIFAFDRNALVFIHFYDGC